MTERSLLFVMKPSSWILTESGYCNIFSSHPWTLIVQRLAVCFDVPERIERAPVFPHNWMIFAFILCVEEKGAQQWCYMRQYKMNSRHARGDCKYRWNACLYTHARTRTHTYIHIYRKWHFHSHKPFPFHRGDKSSVTSSPFYDLYTLTNSMRSFGEQRIKGPQVAQPWCQ